MKLKAFMIIDQWIANLMKILFSIFVDTRIFHMNNYYKAAPLNYIFYFSCVSVGCWPGMNLLLCSSSLLVTALVSLSSPSPTSPWAPSRFKGSSVWRQQSKRNLASFKNKFGYKDERMKRDLVHPLMFRRETRSLLWLTTEQSAVCSILGCHHSILTCEAPPSDITVKVGTRGLDPWWTGVRRPGSWWTAWPCPPRRRGCGSTWAMASRRPVDCTWSHCLTSLLRLRFWRWMWTVTTAWWW